MTGPFEKPTDIRFYSKPALGTKAVTADERASAAIVAGMESLGMEAYRTPVGDGMYSITVTKL